MLGIISQANIKRHHIEYEYDSNLHEILQI